MFLIFEFTDSKLLIFLVTLLRPMIQKLFKIFRKKNPMDFLVDYVNDNLEDIYMSKIENEKDRELRDYCIRSLAEKKYKKEMDQFYRSCMRVLI